MKNFIQNKSLLFAHVALGLMPCFILWLFGMAIIPMLVTALANGGWSSQAIPHTIHEVTSMTLWFLLEVGGFIGLAGMYYLLKSIFTGQRQASPTYLRVNSLIGLFTLSLTWLLLAADSITDAGDFVFLVAALSYSAPIHAIYIGKHFFQRVSSSHGTPLRSNHVINISS